jgi:hypothetical protein
VTPEPSPIDAATEAYAHTGRHLFPFRFERWLALGLVAFLDQCGRGGIGGGFPGGPGPIFRDSGGSTGGGNGGLGEIGAWIAAHVSLVVGLAALGIALVLALAALVLWINSRATFVYIDDVATGRAEIAAPWRAHAAPAWSYFGWRFGIMLGAFALILTFVGLGVAAVLTLQDSGWAMAAALLVLVPALIVLLVGAALLSVALRDFVAPIQMAAGVGCGPAMRILWALVRAHPLAFFLYVVLKVVFSIAMGIVVFVGGCLTCCCLLIPVVTQTALQPLFYFERAWPLYLLRQMGHDLVSGGPPAAPAITPAGPPPTGGIA